MLLNGGGRRHLPLIKSLTEAPIDIAPIKTRASEIPYCISTMMRTHEFGLPEGLMILSETQPINPTQTSSSQSVSLRPRGGTRDGVLATTELLILLASIVEHTSSDFSSAALPS